MGYLSQKKLHKRENIVLMIMIAVVIVLTACFVMNPDCSCKYFNLFHLYCLTGLLSIYAIWRQKYKAAILFVIFFLISYISLAAYTNIFLSDDFDGTQSLELAFNPKQKLIDSFDKTEIMNAGTIIVAKKYTAHYVLVNKQTPLMIIEVDFSRANKADYPLIFKHLHEFILKNDNPVIIFGKFGIPAWSKPFKEFINISGLTVKNRLIFDRGFNIFATPDFYILGFRDMGIKDISATCDNNNMLVRALIAFNPAKI